MSLPPKAIPKAARRVQRDLFEELGQEPTVERIGKGYRLSLSNERVSMTIDYRHNGDGRLKWMGSTLTVDGEPRPIAKGLKHFARIFRDPDHGDEEPGFQVAEDLEEELPPASVEDAPTVIRIIYDRFMGVAETRAVLGSDGRRWSVTFEKPGCRLRMMYRWRGKHAGWQSGKRDLHVVIDGVDRTEEVRGDMEKAVALMNKSAGPGAGPAAGTSDVAGESGAARSTSVETRKSTVLRI